MADPFGDEPLEPGDLLRGGYCCEAVLSRGAMGAVYTARQQESGTRVAVKCLLDDANAARFEIEARLLQRLHHPRIPAVLDYYTEGGVDFLVMELVAGPDLRRVLREQTRVPCDEAVTYALEAADALAYVHGEQIIHRDVKPQNLILGAGGVALVDFGIARETPPPNRGATIGIGTVGYMAPEVMEGGAVSGRADIYGLAATLWALLAGEPPRYGAANALQEQVDGVSDHVALALERALMPDPEERFGTMEAFAQALGPPLEERGSGRSLSMVISVDQFQDGQRDRIVREAAALFDAAAAYIALPDRRGGLRYEVAWGAGAQEIIGGTLEPGQGLAGAVFADAKPIAVPACREDPRVAAEVAAGTGFVPHTMALAPLLCAGRVVGVLSILDRRDGRSYEASDLGKLERFAEVAAESFAPA